VDQAARVNYTYHSPGSRGRAFRLLATTGLLSILLGLCLHVAEIRPTALFEPTALTLAWGFIRNLFPPDLSPQSLSIALASVSRTIEIAISGIFLALGPGLILGICATPLLWERGVLQAGEPPSIWKLIRLNSSRLARAALGLLRAVPDLVWALLFAVTVGLGPLAGILALAVSYIGILGRMYAHLFEDVDPRPIEALHASGATRIQIFLLAIRPQATANVIAYTLYSFECCMRAAAIMGFIGAGGIGYEINVSMRLFEYRQALTLIVALIALVAITDGASKMLRRRLRANSPVSLLRPLSGQKGRQLLWWFKPGGCFLSLGILSAIVWSFLAALLVVGRAGDPKILERGTQFLMRMLPPNCDYDFLHSLLYPLTQTIAVSIVGTLIGVIIGAVLAFLAIIIPFPNRVHEAGKHPLIIRAIRWGIYNMIFTTLNLLRSIPEMVWVLICILAVGIGPFAGTIAIGVHTGGVLGKLYAEIMEEAPSPPIESMRAIGGRPLQILAWAIWPQARPTLVSYTILRWEMNLRVSTVLGLVGGGGLGQIIYNNIQLGFYSNVATSIVVIYIMVMITDRISHRLRAHLTSS
jgi:phosphonate transport system permease protein